MRTNILCRERLNRLIGILDRGNEATSIRDLYRTFGIEGWEVEQAEKLGWVRIYVRKTPLGRPSTRVEKVSKCHHAKLPPFRYAIPNWIKLNHRSFAEWTQCVVTARSQFGFRMLSNAEAYMRAYPKCRNRYAAAASASRLMKRTDVKLMIRWLQCESNGQVELPMPYTIPELIQQLQPLEVLRFKNK